MTFSVYPYGLKELIERLQFSSSEKVIFCRGDTATTCKLSDSSIEYDALFNKGYATKKGKLYAGRALIPYTKVTSTYYQTLPKKTLLGRLRLTMLIVNFSL